MRLLAPCRKNQEIAMGEPLPSSPKVPNPPENRLDSWKEIATYLNRDITTVQRWEKREDMPVHRHLHDRRGSVYAFPGELDAWISSRKLPPVEESAGTDSKAGSQRETGPNSRWKWKLLWATVGVVVLAVGIGTWLSRTEFFWKDPLTGAHFQPLTDRDGIDQAATVSRDGHLVAFLSNRGDRTDVWLTQVGSGQFHNLTNGAVADLVNPSVRTLGFSPDGSLVTFWERGSETAKENRISIWAVPTLGGQPRPYLEGAAELDWSREGGLLAYHTPGPGDPLFVTKGEVDRTGKPIFAAATGLHSHYPLWSQDAKFLYFVKGTLPDKLDIWRIRANGGSPQQITRQNAYVSHPVWLDHHTLLYLAGNPDGTGPSLYSVEVENRVAHRLTPELERYTSLSASDNGRLVLTVASPKKTLWRMPLDNSLQATPEAIPLTTSSGSSPRIGPNFLIYVSSAGSNVSVWKLANGVATALWQVPEVRIVGGPTLSADGREIAISVEQQGRARLFILSSNGTDVKLLSDSLELQGDPVWAPDMQSITSAALDRGVPRLFRIPTNGGAATLLVNDYALNPAWAGNDLILFSGPDVGTMVSLHAANADGSAHPLPEMALTRGARRVAFLAAQNSVVVLRGEIHHKDLWAVNLQSGAERQLTHFPPDFDVSDFDLSLNGRDLVLERVQDRSDIVLFDLQRR
jgi:Tol biopolymer transport system component